MFSRVRRPASGTRRIDQKTVRSAMTTVIVHERNILLYLVRYVCSQTRSEGAGAGLASRVIGSGSMSACTAICYELVSTVDWLSSRETSIPLKLSSPS